MRGFRWNLKRVLEEYQESFRTVTYSFRGFQKFSWGIGMSMYSRRFEKIFHGELVVSGIFQELPIRFQFQVPWSLCQVATSYSLKTMFNGRGVRLNGNATASWN